MVGLYYEGQEFNGYNGKYYSLVFENGFLGIDGYDFGYDVYSWQDNDVYFWMIQELEQMLIEDSVVVYMVKCLFFDEDFVQKEVCVYILVEGEQC